MNSTTVAFAALRDPPNGLIRTRIDERCPTVEDNGNRLSQWNTHKFILSELQIGTRADYSNAE